MVGINRMNLQDKHGGAAVGVGSTIEANLQGALAGGESICRQTIVLSR